MAAVVAGPFSDAVSGQSGWDPPVLPLSGWDEVGFRPGNAGEVDGPFGATFVDPERFECS